MKIVIINRNFDVISAICSALVEEFNNDVQMIDYETPLSDDDVVKLENADLIILNLTNVSKSAILFISEIGEAFSKPKIMVLHFYKERSFVIPMFQAGASAYLHIDNLRNEIEQALVAIQNGVQYVSSEVL
ncbi:MAG: hypothetical protein K9H16_15235 [Bacteroidales bacterium]|nr:hypothetical protein [Bacteroidales bacterium]